MTASTTQGQARATGPDDESDPVNVARILVLRRLDSAPRTRAELESYLRKRGVPDDAAGAVLDRFEEVGLIDDAAFADGWVRSRHGSKGLGRRAVAAELRRKGVSDEIVSAALEPIDEGLERERALGLARARLPQVIGLPYPTQVRRMMGALTRRGYDLSMSSEVVRQVLGEASAGAE
ncbi:MAG: hypothetical protein B7C55_00645 [Actinomycetales bacterium mxb001]|nr:MAG: hypothetical protein B7C55_00645 [Actinomycetales bacterium mxb001]